MCEGEMGTVASLQVESIRRPSGSRRGPKAKNADRKLPKFILRSIRT